MNTISGSVLQRNISKVFPNKLIADIVEILLLMLIGMLAITLHAKLRIPMHLPGKQGFLFMLFIVLARSTSKFGFATSLTCFGASILLFLNVFGFNDPFMPLVYILLGVVMDIMFGILNKFKPHILFIGIAGGISWLSIPLFRLLFGAISGFPYLSLAGGIAFPLITHFIFGLSGGLLGATLISVLNKKKQQTN
jgi:hypothetical protein